MEALAQLRYAFASCVGRVLSDVELNTVCATHVDRGKCYAKRRRWFVAPLVAAGNVYLKRLGAHARVLSDHEWRRWEAAVYRVVYGVDLAIDERGRLLIPAWSGVSVAVYLESEAAGLAEKLGAIRLAVHSLCRLHGVVMEWPDGQTRPLSHGDATVENVIIDSARMHASWFDFDTIHESRMDAAWRHADDLRALTYSAAERLPAASFPEMTETIVQSYCFAATLEALAEAVTYRQTRPISFHLAQARIGYRERRLLDETLLNSLSRRDKT